MSKEQVEPGDLAVIVSVDQPEDIGDLGAFVNVLSPDGAEPGWWNIEAVSRPLRCFDLDTHEFIGMESTDMIIDGRHLRPIRDNPPGQDETLRWADVPRNDYVDAGFMPLGD